LSEKPAERQDTQRAPEAAGRSAVWKLTPVLKLALCAGALLAGTRGTQDAVANGDTRTLSILHMHTKEETTVTFKRNGYYDGSALEKLNYALRDWRNDEQIKFDPRLFDVAWEVHRSVGSSEPLHVVSAYRSPGTNAMLRRRSRGVAKHSQHMLGKAMDFYLPDVSPARIREIGVRLQRGGVGYYPTAYTPFVHLDVGSVRSWPRLTRDQLVRLFPDGKTVHLPTDGEPLPGYELAKAEILARGGSVAGYAAADLDEGAIMAGGSRSSFWSFLFGGGEEEQDARPTRGRRGGAVVASRRSGQSTTLAYAPATSSDNDPLGRFGAPVQANVEAAVPLREQMADRAPARRGASTPADEPKVAAAAETPPAQAPAAEMKQPSLVAAPLPSARPRNLTLPETAPEPVQTASLSAVSEALGGRLVPAPLPPSRPSGVTALPIEAQALANQATKPSENGDTRAIGGKWGALTHPSPPARPAGMVADDQPVASRTVAANRPVSAAASGREGDRAALDLLFADASRTTSAKPVRIMTAKAKQMMPAGDGAALGNAPVAAFGFSRGKATDMSTDRFSGQAVKPLPSNFIQQ
jgi:uncharacterized protein YcbK (DUF882 family)